MHMDKYIKKNLICKYFYKKVYIKYILLFYELIKIKNKIVKMICKNPELIFCVVFASVVI